MSYLGHLEGERHRWKEKGVTAETMKEIGHSEEKIKPFYEELEKRTDILRSELSRKK